MYLAMTRQYHWQEDDWQEGEVGMYLAMTRQVDREGYPEVARVFEHYAYEEAKPCKSLCRSAARSAERHQEQP